MLAADCYYNARYYKVVSLSNRDPLIGRFISTDTVVQDYNNPQTLNRYSYCSNKPLRYTDPTGHGWWSIITDISSIAFDVYQMAKHPSWGNAGWLAMDIALTCLPIVPAGVGPLAKGVGKGIEVTEDVRKIERVAKDLDKTAEGVKLLEKTSDAVDAGRELNRAADILETGVKEVHGNSLLTTKTAYGYTLTDRTTNEILKYGETIHPDTRYSGKFLNSINANMNILAEGSKSEMHFWQQYQVLDYFNAYGVNPHLNINGW